MKSYNPYHRYIMKFKLQLVAYLSDDRQSITEDVITLNRDDLTLENLDLTLAESKNLLKTVQQKMIDRQVAGHVQAHIPIGLRKQGTYPIQLKTLFGDVSVERPRYYHPQQETGAKTFSPLS